jgi:hypothetical protein
MSRSDKTAVKLFLTGIWGWEFGIRLRLDVEKCSEHQRCDAHLRSFLESNSLPRSRRRGAVLAEKIALRNITPYGVMFLLVEAASVSFKPVRRFQ